MHWMNELSVALAALPVPFTGGLVVGLVLGISARFALRALAAVAVVLALVELVARTGALAHYGL